MSANLIDDKVLKLIESHLTPRQEEKKTYGEVFTPIDTICEMLNQLPSNVWTNPNLKWLDPSSGIGNFIIVVYYKLFASLKTNPTLRNDKKRSKWIIEKMLFMNELNPKNVTLTKKIFKMIVPDASPNIFKGDFLKNNTILNNMDIIIGNPPYNEPEGSESLYTKFILKILSDNFKGNEFKGKLLFLVPSRWFTSVKGLNDFREFMLNRDDIVFINHIPDSKTIWPTVDIAGGVNYFLIDTEYSGPSAFTDTETKTTTNLTLNKFDILVPNTKAYSIINKILDKPKLSDIYLSTKYYGINTNSRHFQNVNEQTKSGRDLVKCYVSKRKGSIKYVDKKHIQNPYHFWKVFVTQGNGKVNDGFINFIIGSPNEIASQSYFTLKTKSKEEAESLISYLETYLANFMLWLRKIDHHINKDTLSWIPLPPLNKKWTNSSVQKYYKLTDTEIKTISSKNNMNKPKKGKTRKQNGKNTNNNQKTRKR
jgi:hypothetical protein